MIPVHPHKQLVHLSRAGALAGVLVLATGCASAPVAPTSALDAARTAIQLAQSDDASHFAAAELDRARRSLAAADTAVLAGDMTVARRRADEAAITAQLASARTEAMKAEAINAEMKRGSEAMLEEIQRAGDRQ